MPAHAPPLPLLLQLCSANGNSECNETVALDGPTCPPWVPPPPPEPEGGSNTSAIVGGVVGGVAGGILLAAGVVLVLRWNKRRKQRMSPFIAEAQGPVAPSKDDLSKYSRVLESVEGGGDAKHENKREWQAPEVGLLPQLASALLSLRALCCVPR